MRMVVARGRTWTIPMNIEKIKLIPADAYFFKCDCGHPCYLQLEQDEYGILWVTGMEEYPTLWERVKAFFNGNRCVFEFVMYPKQQKKLKRFIEKLACQKPTKRKNG